MFVPLATRFAGLHHLLRVAAPALVLISLLLVASGPLQAQAKKQRAYGQGILFKVEKEGRDPSFVFGTMHVPNLEVVSILEKVEAFKEAFKKTKVAGFEIIRLEDPDEETSVWYTNVYQLDGRTLDMIIGRELMEKLLKIARRRGINSTYLHNVKPSVAAGVVYYSRKQQALARDNKPRMDTKLRWLAERDGKKIIAVEDRFEHAWTLSKLSEDDQVRLLKWSVSLYEDQDAAEQRIADAIRLYTERNIDALYDRWEEELAQLPPDSAKAWHEAMISERNKIMVEFGGKHFAEGGFFMSVGALHLPGDDGVLKLLEQEGYTISRLY